MRASRKIMALAMTVLMLAVPMTVVTVIDEDDESDGNPLYAAGRATGFAVKFYMKHQKEINAAVKTLAAVFLGIEIKDSVVDYLEGDPSDDVYRSEEATMLAQAMLLGMTQYSNAVENYANIWGLTDEHWIRQAELTSASYWGDGVDYSTYNAMVGSTAWYNSTVLLENGVSQMNTQFVELSKHVSNWNDSSVSKYYGEGKMVLAFSSGDRTVSVTSEDELTVRMCTVIRPQVGSTVAYYAGGPLFASQDCTIVSMSGHRIDLHKGWNLDLEGVESFQHSDIYTFPQGTTFGGTILPVNLSGASPVMAGMIVSNGSDDMVLTCYDDVISDGVQETGGLMMRIIPQDSSDTQEADISAMLVNYSHLLSEVNRVLNDADQAARVVWKIYDEHRSCSAYLTTLIVPETYGNVVLTDNQRELITTMAMQQLSQWYQETEPSGTRYYTMTQDSLSLYCRGTITVKGTTTGGSVDNVVYENAVFTPIFYNDASLNVGTNTFDRGEYGFIMVWGTDSSLSTFDMASTDYSDLLWIGDGATLQIAEMMYDGRSVTSVDLDATNVDYIAPLDMDADRVLHPSEGDDRKGLIMLVLVVLGVASILISYRRGSFPGMLAGVVLILIGLFLSGWISDLFSELDLLGRWSI